MDFGLYRFRELPKVLVKLGLIVLQDDEYGGHWPRIPPVESMSYGGIHFPVMHAQPYHHNLNPVYSNYFLLIICLLNT